MWRVILTDGNLSWWFTTTLLRFDQNPQFLMGQDGRTVYWRHTKQLAGTIIYVPNFY